MINLRDNKIKTFSVKKLLIASFAFCVSVMTAGYAQAATDINYTTTVKDSSGTKVQTGTDSTANITGAKLNPSVNEKAKGADASAKKAAEDTSKSAAAEAKDVNYSGLYNGKEIVPNIMAIYCKTNAEEFLADPTKMDKCIQKYIAAMNSRNAAAREEGLNDYNNLVLKVLMKMMSEAVAKGASTANYDDVANKTAEKTSQTETIHEDGAGISYTTSLSTDVINRLRELSVTTLFWQVVQGMRFVDPSIIDEEIREEAEAQAANNIIKDKEASNKGQDGQLNVSTEATLGNGYGSSSDEEDDKTYQGGALDEVVVTAPSKTQEDSYVATQYPTPWNSSLQQTEQAPSWNNMYPNNQQENIQVPYRPADSDIDEEDDKMYEGGTLKEVIVKPEPKAQENSSDSTQYSAPWNNPSQQNEQAPVWNNMYPNNQQDSVQAPYRPADFDTEVEEDEFTMPTMEKPEGYMTEEQIRQAAAESAASADKTGEEAKAMIGSRWWDKSK